MSKLTYRVFKGTPQAIWTAITDPAQVARYGYGGNLEIDPRAGASYNAGSTEEQKPYGMPSPTRGAAGSSC